jgi:hypothetical protein
MVIKNIRWLRDKTNDMVGAPPIITSRNFSGMLAMQKCGLSA